MNFAQIERIGPLIKEIMSMSFSEQQDLFQALEEELLAEKRPIPWSQEPPVCVMDPPEPGMEVDDKEYDLILLGEEKNDPLWTIRVVRAVSDLSATEANELVRSAPVVIRRGLDCDTAFDIQETFREASVQVEICESEKTEAWLEALQNGEAT